MTFRSISIFIILFFGATFTLQKSSVEGKNFHSEEIDCIANEALKNFDVPGVAIGIVFNDQIVTQGYGFRNLDQVLPVTDKTLFPIASCTKAFTAMLLGQLVSEGKIAFDDPVNKYIPEFFSVDLERTDCLTIRDLLAHRTGIARHDSIWFLHEISRSSILEIIKKLEPACNLRAEFQYNNFMYTIAGMVIERVLGQPWEEIVMNRLLKPLNMNLSNTSLEVLQNSSDYSLPYAEIHGVIKQIPFRNIQPLCPAGGINSNVQDMVNWLKLHLSQGYNSLIQPEILEEMHVVQMPIAITLNKMNSFSIEGYGLGWLIGKYRENRLIIHDGDLDGFSSEVALLPDIGLGIVLLTNSSSDGKFAITAIRNQIIDKILGIEDIDWTSELQNIRTAAKKSLIESLEMFNEGSIVDLNQPLEAYAGCYSHPAYGTLEIKIENGQLNAYFGNLWIPLYFKSNDLFICQSPDLLYYGVNPLIDFKFVKDDLGNFYKIEVPFEGFRAAKPIIFMREPFNPINVLNLEGQLKTQDNPGKAKTYEEEFAYFFGVKNEQPVAEAYFAALQKLNTIELDSTAVLEKEVLPYLEKAYKSVAAQRNWTFDTHLAAKLELQIILGNLRGSDFEDVQNLMVQLYELVFQLDSPLIAKAAMLRTFLYQYKTSILKTGQQLSLDDLKILLEISKASKEILNKIK